MCIGGAGGCRIGGGGLICVCLGGNWGLQNDGGGGGGVLVFCMGGRGAGGCRIGRGSLCVLGGGGGELGVAESRGGGGGEGGGLVCVCCGGWGGGEPGVAESSPGCGGVEVGGGGGRLWSEGHHERDSLQSPSVQHVSGHVPLVRLDVHLQDINNALQSYRQRTAHNYTGTSRHPPEVLKKRKYDHGLSRRSCNGSESNECGLFNGHCNGSQSNECGLFSGHCNGLQSKCNADSRGIVTVHKVSLRPIQWVL